MPILPVLLGAGTAMASILAGGITIVLVSGILAFLSGMKIGRRILTNLLIIAATVSVSYLIGTLVRRRCGIEL